ncbi:catalase, partial [Streptosporangium algeriense]
DFEALRGAVVGRLSIGAFPTAARGLLPAALAHLQRRHPDLRLQLHEREPERQLREVSRGELDLAVVQDWMNRPLAVPEGLSRAMLFDDVADAILPSCHPLADRQEIELSELSGERWISSSPGTVCHDWLVYTLRSAELEPDIACMADEYPTHLALVAAGQGCAIIPRLGRDFVPDGVRIIPLRPRPTRKIYALWRTDAARRPAIRAAFLAKDVETPVFVRFSTVLGSRGSADTVRDTRGFATKFYTGEGVFDLVGNNIPVFFIQDAIKFPDVIHAAKPHPDREIPQAQSAHDTFWDFVSLHTEATHHTLWNMSDRGIPRSYRTMEGFGVHTFRLVDAEGATTLVKFHWKPKAGVHSLVWEEAQLIGGADPDFHRRDLADAIEAGAHPQWELGIQVFPDTPEQTFEGIDLLDPTKIVPEELAPVQPIGLLTLNANPVNYFAETEQVAFHVGHLVPGIDVTDDPLLAGRLFSYLDTQITRLGGPNFGQIPINRTHAPVNDMLRDGFHQDAVHAGVAPYKPNSLDGGCPFFAGAHEGGYVETPVRVAAARKVREAPASFADHFSQPRLFWLSLSPVEREHVIAAYTFELGKVYEQAIKERNLRVLAEIDPYLCEQVAQGLGLPVPKPVNSLPSVNPSPALSQVGRSWPTTGRIIGIVADGDGDLAAVEAVRRAVLDGG